MKIAIVGSRNLKVDISNFVDRKIITEIITGGARGIDKCAYLFAKKEKIPVKIVSPDYEKFGKMATVLRNKKIVDLCDSLVAIWDGVSRGTKITIKFAMSSRKPITIFKIKDNLIKKEVYDVNDQIRLF